MLLAWTIFFALQALWIAALSCWQNLVFDTQTSDCRSNMPIYPAAFRRSCTTCRFIVPLYENVVCFVKKVSFGISSSCQYRCKPTGLSRFKNISSENKTFLHFSTSIVWLFLVNSNLAVLWRWKERVAEDV